MKQQTKTVLLILCIYVVLQVLVQRLFQPSTTRESRQIVKLRVEDIFKTNSYKIYSRAAAVPWSRVLSASVTCNSNETVSIKQALYLIAVTENSFGTGDLSPVLLFTNWTFGRMSELVGFSDGSSTTYVDTLIGPTTNHLLLSSVVLNSRIRTIISLFQQATTELLSRDSKLSGEDRMEAINLQSLSRTIFFCERLGDMLDEKSPENETLVPLLELLIIKEHLKLEWRRRTGLIWDEQIPEIPHSKQPSMTI